VTFPAPLVKADGVETTAAPVDTRVTEDVIAPVHVPAPVPETVTGMATGAPTAAPTGLAPILMAAAAGGGALGGVADKVSGGAFIPVLLLSTPTVTTVVEVQPTGRLTLALAVFPSELAEESGEVLGDAPPMDKSTSVSELVKLVPVKSTVTLAPAIAFVGSSYLTPVRVTAGTSEMNTPSTQTAVFRKSIPPRRWY